MKLVGVLDQIRGMEVGDDQGGVGQAQEAELRRSV